MIAPVIRANLSIVSHLIVPPRCGRFRTYWDRETLSAPLSHREREKAVRTRWRKQSGHFASALAEPKFALFAAGQLISQFGDYLAQMALIAVIGAYTTRAPLAYSQITVAIALPALLFGPIVGVVVDRRAKNQVLIVADASRAVIIGLIPLLMKVTGSVLILFPLVFISFLMGLFASAARLSLIPYLVPQNKIFAANAVMNFINKLAGMVGFVGGGLLVVGGFWRHLKLQPWEAGFYLDSLSFLISVITIAMLKTGEEIAPSEKEANLVQLWRRRINNLKTDLRELWTLIFSSPKVKFVMFSLLLVAIFGGTLYPLVVVIVQKGIRGSIGSGTGGVGVLGGVFALGMMLGSLSIGFLGTPLLPPDDHRLRAAGGGDHGQPVRPMPPLLAAVAGGPADRCFSFAGDGGPGHACFTESAPDKLWGQDLLGARLRFERRVHAEFIIVRFHRPDHSSPAGHHQS